MQKEDPTIAELFKAQGYATGQFGKNHLGDRNEYLPTVHGFDEFYGNLYHLNAEEEPEDCRTTPRTRRSGDVRPPRRAGLQGLGHGRPDGRPALRQGRQAGVQGHRPADRKRMETMVTNIAARAVDFIQRQDKAGKPAFVCGELHPHARSSRTLSPESIGRRGAGRSLPRCHDGPR